MKEHTNPEIPLSWEIEDTAHEMCAIYGKENASERVNEITYDYLQDIKNLKHYDTEKIDGWRKSRNFWLSVKDQIDKI